MSIEGQFVIQCKFTSKRDYNLRASDLSDELNKTRRLVAQGRCENYILITNAGLTGNQEKNIYSLYKEVGVKHIIIHGSTWICNQIRENKRLRMLVPRLYGLGDLSQILDERAYSQARALLDTMRDDLAKIVITQSYRAAAKALEEHGFVLLIGEPAAGKTTIASMLAMSAIDLWQSTPLKLDDPRKVIDHWNPDEPSQFFWIDDAFGVTQYESHLVFAWNHVLVQIRAMIKKGAKIVMTSRDYIYNRARKELKESAFPLLKESQVVIDVHELSIEEKRQILYNHMKMGEQPTSFRAGIKPFLEDIANNPRFIPETARRLANPIFTKGLKMSSSTIARYVAMQESFLQELLQGLDSDCKAGLALIYMRNDDLQSPIQLEESEKQVIDRLGSSIGGSIAGLESLDGSIVQLYKSREDVKWRFKHPTIGDAYAQLLAARPELLSIFVQGTTVERLIGQVTCGFVGYENTVVIGKSLYPLMLKRLAEFITDPGFKSRWKAQQQVDYFLSRRCSKEFLKLYIENNPDFLDYLSKPGLYLESVSELDVALKLHKLGLLPEEKRQSLVNVVTEYAVQGEDFYVLTSRELKSIFTEAENQILSNRLFIETVPRLKDIREDWEFNWDSDYDREQYMQSLLDGLNALMLECNDPETKQNISYEVQRIEEWIEEQDDCDENDIPPRRKISDIDVPSNDNSVRSIFDDVDM